MNQATPDDTTTLGVVHDLPDLSSKEFAAVMVAASTMLNETARLAEIADLGFEDVKAAKCRLFSEHLPPKPLMPIYHAVAMYLTAMTPSTSPMEFEVQDEFFARLDHYLPGAIQAIGPAINGIRPDGFVFMDGALAPVEVKRHVFGKAALKQLLGYVEAHGASRGIAVAPELGCDLPDGITFVAVQAGETL